MSVSHISDVVQTPALWRLAGFIHHHQQQWQELEYVDSWGVDVPYGKQTSFPRAVELQENETVCFSWIVWESKEIRDAGMKKVREDPRMHPDQLEIPFDQIFDHQRMIMGLFEMVAYSSA